LLEVKTFAGAYRNTGEHWEFRSGHRWHLLHQSPSRQAQNAAVRLKGFFKADGIQQWVDPVVVWADPSGALSVENPMVAVWTIERLPEEASNVWTRQVTDPSTRERVIEKLTLLCQRQRESSQRQ
jgi:hypothetical protein